MDNITITYLSEEEEEDYLIKRYDAFKHGIVKVLPGNWIFPKGYTKICECILNLEVKRFLKTKLLRIYL